MTEKGARYIVVEGLPPLGCSPLELFVTKQADKDQKGCSTSINGMTKVHNDLLQKTLQEFQKQHKGCAVLYADYWGAFNNILDNHKKYKLEHPFKTCCGSGSGELNYDTKSTCGSFGTSACKDQEQYINWDGIHFTEAMNERLADLFLNQGYCKPSFDSLTKMKLGVNATA